jgi:hypothetical protein
MLHVAMCRAHRRQLLQTGGQSPEIARALADGKAPVIEIGRSGELPCSLCHRGQGAQRFRDTPPSSSSRLMAWLSTGSSCARAFSPRPSASAPTGGVSWANWERALAARQEDAGRALAELRQLGSKQAPRQLLLTLDEVLTSAQARGQFH